MGGIFQFLFIQYLIFLIDLPLNQNKVLTFSVFYLTIPTKCVVWMNIVILVPVNVLTVDVKDEMF